MQILLSKKSNIEKDFKDFTVAVYFPEAPISLISFYLEEVKQFF